MQHFEGLHIRNYYAHDDPCGLIANLQFFERESNIFFLNSWCFMFKIDKKKTRFLSETLSAGKDHTEHIIKSELVLLISGKMYRLTGLHNIHIRMYYNWELVIFFLNLGVRMLKTGLNMSLSHFEYNEKEKKQINFIQKSLEIIFFMWNNELQYVIENIM